MREHRRTVKAMPGGLTRSVSMLDGWHPYRWRDPARCSPDRLAELAAHDDYIAGLQEMWRQPGVYQKIWRQHD